MVESIQAFSEVGGKAFLAVPISFLSLSMSSLPPKVSRIPDDGLHLALLRSTDGGLGTTLLTTSSSSLKLYVEKRWDEEMVLNLKCMLSSQHAVLLF